MNTVGDWAEAIGVSLDREHGVAIGSIIAHIRGAILEAGFVSRGRITSGLKEAYRPLKVDEAKLRDSIEEAIHALILCGDIDEFSTSTGRSYAPTPPRLVDFGSEELALLGGIGGGRDAARVRRVGRSDGAKAGIVSLSEELGRPVWRSILVGLGGADDPAANVSALFHLAAAFAANGDRYSLDEPKATAVLSGRGRFFGQAEGLSGRWKSPNGNGCFPAVVKIGFSTQHVILFITERAATLWHAPSLDVWRWIVVGVTVAAGDPVVEYDSGACRLNFLTPPPHQLERVALITGTKIGPWAWEVPPRAFAMISELLGFHQ
jgi:hypothetical protein